MNFLLLFLNSSIANKLIHGINHTSNNSANYLKSLPIIINDNYIKKANQIVKKYKEDSNMEDYYNKIDKLFETIYK